MLQLGHRVRPELGVGHLDGAEQPANKLTPIVRTLHDRLVVVVAVLDQVARQRVVLNPLICRLVEYSKAAHLARQGGGAGRKLILRGLGMPPIVPPEAFRSWRASAGDEALAPPRHRHYGAMLQDRVCPGTEQTHLRRRAVGPCPPAALSSARWSTRVMDPASRL